MRLKGRKFKHVEEDIVYTISDIINDNIVITWDNHKEITFKIDEVIKTLTLKRWKFVQNRWL